ncbi:MAG: TIGR03545 family protein [Desulfurivibrionaceae bacterium]|nr:TIGR03545 family protein [Desulfurivibrionaceae bacterium]
MKKIIRWQGFTYFGVLLALLCFFTFFFIDNFIRRQIEKLGSAMVGAKVELAKADLSFFPAGLELSRLQITNPDNPMRNTVEIERIAMTINAMRLLERKIIIEEMAAEGIRPDTPRDRSGVLPQHPARQTEPGPEKTKEGFKVPDLEIPDVKEVLAREKLESITLAADYRNKLDEETARWQQRLAALPDQEKLDGYKKRLEKLKGGSGGLAGLLGGATELVALRKEIQADLDRLRAARDEFEKTSESYRKDLAELKNIPRRDLERLVDKYTPSAEGLANLSAMVFGDKTGNIVRKSLFWYEKAQPLLARTTEKKEGNKVVKPIRGEGVWVKFEEKNPLPEFLIRRIAASAEIEAGRFDGTIINVTPDQDILGAPLTFNFSGEALRELRAINFVGAFNHVNPDRPRDSLNLAIQGYSIQKIELSDNDTLPLAIESGLADLEGQAVLQGNKIGANLQVRFSSARFIVDSSRSGSAVTRALAEALAEISNFTAQVEIDGEIDDYTMRISSDLDQVLKNAVSRTINKKTADFARDLKENITAKVGEPLAAAESAFTDFGNISEIIAARLQMGDNLLR